MADPLILYHPLNLGWHFAVLGMVIVVALVCFGLVIQFAALIIAEAIDRLTAAVNAANEVSNG